MITITRSMIMKKNWVIVLTVIVLFTAVFFLGNHDFFIKNNSQLVHNGIGKIKQTELNEQEILKLNGEWTFYPNVLIAPDEPLGKYEPQRLTIDVPSNWKDYVEPNNEGLSIGTYHVKIEVPTDQQYGLYIRTIRQSNRIFINGHEVGGMGNPTALLKEFKFESDDRFPVFAASEDGVLDIVIHVANHTYAEAGILYSIEIGTKEAIQNNYRIKVAIDALVSVGYIIFGCIYVISYIQSRKRKEELFFGLFAVLFGLYMSFINQKVFFLIFPSIDVEIHVRLQLGILPLTVACLTQFIHCMYPEFFKKKMLYVINTLLVIIFLNYGIFKIPFPIIESLKITQILYVAVIIPLGLYNFFVLFRALRNKVEGASYILTFLIAFACYSFLLAMNFIFGIPINFSELLLFVLVLYSFTSLLSYRANEAYNKVQTLSEELLVYNQMKDEFLLKTSHELRTPLNGILNLSKNLMEGTEGPLKRTQQETVILIHNITQRLGYLVEDLLFSSNHMTGDILVTPRVVSMNVIDEVIAEIRNLLPNEQSVKIISAIDANLPAIYTDELRLKQVLYNLMHNAIQHTLHGQIMVLANVRREQMEIQVSDTGTGIPSQDLERIFNAFYQVRKDTHNGGLGLGLSITKNIVEKLNGEIRVMSTLGVGTIFTFTMPLATADQIEKDSIKNQVAHRVEHEAFQLKLPLVHKGNDKTILVVDDDHVNIKVLADTLTKEGYSFIAVDNGYDALEFLNTNKVDCMLIDLMMNEISGYDLCKKVRQHYDMLELPIIVLTAIMQHSDLVLSLQVGANEYLQKPILMDELLIRIQSLLAVRQSSVEAIEDELNFLYTQVTPHFVYNTLNTIIGLSYTDIDNTREALYCLATYFRAKLNAHYRNSMVPIEEEIDLVKAYLYIEQMRFGERLTVKYEIDETIHSMIPALSIQPLVENAVFHGISKKKEGGTIEVSVQREGQFIRIKIYDDGVGIPEQKLEQLMNEENTRIGFKNPMKKFKLIKNASLRIYSKEGKGTTVIILLPEGEKDEGCHYR